MDQLLVEMKNDKCQQPLILGFRIYTLERSDGKPIPYESEDQKASISALWRQVFGMGIEQFVGTHEQGRVLRIRIDGGSNQAQRQRFCELLSEYLLSEVE